MFFSDYLGSEDLLDNKTKIKECNEIKSASKSYYVLTGLTNLEKRQGMIDGKTILAIFYVNNTRYRIRMSLTYIFFNSMSNTLYSDILQPRDQIFS